MYKVAHMRYMRTYPTEEQLRELAYILPFPMSCDDMVTVARYIGCSPAAVRLLRQFDPEDVFENGVDFINRCQAMRIVMQGERAAPKELLRSPQG